MLQNVMTHMVNSVKKCISTGRTLSFFLNSSSHFYFAVFLNVVKKLNILCRCLILKISQEPGGVNVKHLCWRLCSFLQWLTKPQQGGRYLNNLNKTLNSKVAWRDSVHHSWKYTWTDNRMTSKLKLKQIRKQESVRTKIIMKHKNRTERNKNKIKSVSNMNLFQVKICFLLYGSVFLFFWVIFFSFLFCFSE